MKTLRWLIWPITFVDFLALKFFGAAISLAYEEAVQATPQELIGLAASLLVAAALAAYWITQFVNAARARRTRSAD